MTEEKKGNISNDERYTIFHAVLEAMKDKEQKKSKWARFLNFLGFHK